LEAADDPRSASELLAEGLVELGLEIRAKQLALLVELAQLLERWSARINLSGHRDSRAIVRRLVLDAAALCTALPSLDSLADIGSGAGFPGLPVAILREGCEVTLVESRERRHHFQREAIRRLGLSHVRAVLGRAERLEPAPHRAAIAQAVARPAVALPLIYPWVEVGGLLLLPGAHPAPALPPGDPRILFEVSPRYRVPLGGPERSLQIARRIS
jgi:16S rRNA (guanine527-N7)-methyltransferase